VIVCDTAPRQRLPGTAPVRVLTTSDLQCQMVGRAMQKGGGKLLVPAQKGDEQGRGGWGGCGQSYKYWAARRSPVHEAFKQVRADYGGTIKKAKERHWNDSEERSGTELCGG